MPGWPVLKPVTACCWKVSWNVDPLPLSVPVRLAALLDEDALLLDEDPLLPEEPQAATKETTAAVASPTVVARWMRRRCIFLIPHSPVFPGQFLGRAGTHQPPAASWSACQT